MAKPIPLHNKGAESSGAPQFTASEAKHRFGELLDTALRVGPVTITKQRKPSAVLISIESYRSLTQADDRALAALSAEFDRQFDAMQAPGAAAAMQRAFDTPAAKLGAYAAASIGKPASPKQPAARRKRPMRG